MTTTKRGNISLCWATGHDFMAQSLTHRSDNYYVGIARCSRCGEEKRYDDLLVYWMSTLLWCTNGIFCPILNTISEEWFKRDKETREARCRKSGHIYKDDGIAIPYGGISYKHTYTCAVCHDKREVRLEEFIP